MTDLDEARQKLRDLLPLLAEARGTHLEQCPEGEGCSLPARIATALSEIGAILERGQSANDDKAARAYRIRLVTTLTGVDNWERWIELPIPPIEGMKVSVGQHPDFPGGLFLKLGVIYVESNGSLLTEIDFSGPRGGLRLERFLVAGGFKKIERDHPRQ